MYHHGLARSQRCIRRFLQISAPRGHVYDSILQTIGRTPVVKASKVLPPCARQKGIELYAKLEFFNPTSSVKDRLAVAIIDAAEASGRLKPGMTVVEATSGNTGIALAMVCANRGYPFVAVMGEQYSIERRQAMRALGAKVVLTPKAMSGTGMTLKARELAAAHGWVLARQFENEANIHYHANTTGPEILLDFVGRRLDYWVTGYGTGGTFAGTGKVLKCARPDVRIVLAEPQVAALVSSGTPQERASDGTPAVGHPAFSAHIIQGWTPNFIPAVCQKGLDQKLHDDIRAVADAEALEMARRLATTEGIFAGISAGATAAAAVKVAKDAPEGSVILAMLPDTQERYMSTPLFEAVEAGMTPEECAISRSTLSCHL